MGAGAHDALLPLVVGLVALLSGSGALVASDTDSGIGPVFRIFTSSFIQKTVLALTILTIVRALASTLGRSLTSSDHSPPLISLY